MPDLRIASMSDLGQVLVNYQDATRNFGRLTIRWDNGAFAVDALANATAEELLIAFRSVLPEPLAKQIVGILLDHGLTLDETLDDIGGEL